jgi:C4-dicarboxylate-specific signal transduction histidine kinase
MRLRSITRRKVEFQQEVRRRREAEESLREAETLGRSTLDALTSPVVVLDEKGTIVKVNQAWKQFGEKNIASSELIAGVGWNYLDVCSRAAAEGSAVALRVLEGLRAVLTGRAQIFDLEYDCHSSFENRWFLLRAVPMSGPASGLVISHIDISQLRSAELELRQSEREVQRQRDELAHMQRTAALGELAGALSHEINQPLAAIRANAQAALRYLGQDSPDLGEIREILTDIASDDRRAAEIIQNLRSLVRKQPEAMGQIDINEVVSDATALVRTEALLENIEVVQDLGEELSLVLGERIQLQQVLVNVLLNAFEALAGLEKGEKRVLLQTRSQPDDSVWVSIADTGPGFGDQLPEEIFSTFHTTKPSGLGIGLSTSRTIVESHGGTIWAEGNGREGAAIHFTLPVAAEQARDRD